MNIAILIPTYNERKNISELLPKISGVSCENPEITLDVYVIDDNSPDRTAEMVLNLSPSLQSAVFSINLLNRSKKEGLGRAYIEGFQKALSLKKYQYIIQMDADLSHNPTYLNNFFDAARTQKDMVVASRYLKGGQLPDWSLHRKLLSYFGNLYARCLLGTKISDYTGGYNMYATSVLEAIRVESINEPGYGFLISLKFKAIQASKSVAQFPIKFIDRYSGESKMPINTIVKNFILVFKLWYRR